VTPVPPLLASLRAWLTRLRGTFAPLRSRQDLEDELRAHLALAAEDERRRAGAASDEAQKTRRRVEAVAPALAAMQDQQALPWLRDISGDVRYAVRTLRRSRMFAAAAILSLALGIGVTTAASSIVRTILLAPLPHPDSERLVRVVVASQAPASAANRPRAISYDEFVAWRTQSTTLVSMAAASIDPQVLTRTPTGAARLAGAMVSPEWLELLGARAMLGRTLRPSDIREGRNVVVLGARTWRERFAGDPAVVGKSIALYSRIRAGMQGQSFDIVGVMPDAFRDPTTVWEIDFWAALGGHVPGVRGQMSVGVIGRLAPGVTLAAARDDAAAVVTALRGGAGEKVPIEVETLKERTVARVRPALRVLVVSTACVLLIVCANVAGLLLARGTARRRELAVRQAIGAGRGRIVRQLLVESAVLSAAGGLAGALVAAGALAAVRWLATIQASGAYRLVFGSSVLPRVDELTVDVGVLTFALGLSLMTALVSGVAPALSLSRRELVHATATRSGMRRAEEHRARNLLVVSQLAVATALLVGAALLVRSYANLLRIDAGYQPTGVLAFQLVLPEEYPTARKTAIIESVLARLRATPGVRAAGFSYAGPLIGLVDTAGHFVPPNRTAADMRASGGVPAVRSISHDLLTAIGARVIDGRAFTVHDDATAPWVAVVNRTLARQYFGHASPVGARLLWYGGGEESAPASLQVVGVMDDVRNGRIDGEPRPEVLLDYRQMVALQQGWQAPVMQVERLALGFMSFAVRGSDELSSLARHARQAVTAADPNAGIDAIAPLERLMASSLARPRFYAAVLGLLAAIAAVLAVLGIYSLLSYAVAQRTHEIGVRMALGADRRAVLSLVLRRGLLLSSAGILLGVACAAGLARWLDSLLYGLTSVDAGTYALVAAGCALVTMAACYLPARRATRVDPVVALHAD
jgi:putative ABC transport system permease protein